MRAAGLSGAGIVLGNVMARPWRLPRLPRNGASLNRRCSLSKSHAGSLPPIDARLPDEVFKVGPGVLLQEEYQDWQDGRYGGKLTVASVFPTPFTFLGGGGTILRSPGQTSEKSLPNIVSELLALRRFQSLSLQDSQRSPLVRRRTRDHRRRKLPLRGHLRRSESPAALPVSALHAREFPTRTGEAESHR